MLRRLPKLDDGIYDPMTSGVAPAGRRYQITHAPVKMEHGGRLTSNYRGIEEVADFWQVGDPDSGITTDGADGRILPRVDHVVWGLPLVDVTGADLGLSDVEKEVMRRNWYAEMIAGVNRLTPVHHIIGGSKEAWRGRLSSTDIAERNEWLASIWVPGNLRKLMDTYRGIYDIDWGRLPEDKILSPVESQHRKHERRGTALEPFWRLKLDRARADLATVSRIALAVSAGDMDAATEEHARLAEHAQTYTEATAELRKFGSDPKRSKARRRR